MNTYQHILNIIEKNNAAYFILIDPDKTQSNKLLEFAKYCELAGVDGFLIGGSLMINGDLSSCIKEIKSVSNLPCIIFPGDVNQISEDADAILFLSLVSGRNPEHLIGKHVLAAPRLNKIGLEPISTGYIIVESGKTTTAEYMSGSKPIPRNKPEIATATALAAEYLGMKLIYLEGGSGAENPVPNEMVKMVSENCSIPVIVGGGITTPQIASEKVQNGAKIIITGNFFEDEKNWVKIKEFADVIHSGNQ